jgi:cytochrome P450
MSATSAIASERAATDTAPPGPPPGPRLPRVVQTARMLARPIPFMEDCRRRYGRSFTVRMLGTGTLVFISDPPSIKRLFAADRVNTIAPGRTAILKPLLGAKSVLLLEGDAHMRRRKLMLPPFHGERMRSYEEAIASATRQEIGRWPVGEPFALHPRMQSITLEVIMAAVFGVGAGGREELRERLVRILAVTTSPLAVGLALGGTRRLPPLREVARAAEEVDELLASEIRARRADPEVAEREDILSLLIAARFEDGEQMSDSELRDQLMTLLLAGHETTATALAWTFDLLFRHPQVEGRLQAELADGGSRYLDAVCEESLRVRPVVPFTGRKLLEAGEYGGYEMPVGTVVMAGIYLAQTDPQAHPDPYAFRPERFLGDEKPESFANIPFGGGTRRCLGASFALMEMRIALREILLHTDLRPAGEQPEKPTRRNVTLSPKNGTRAVLAGRN